MEEQEELERLKKVAEIHRERIDQEIDDADKTIALNMISLDKVSKTINKLITRRVFLFNQDNALKDLENAINLPIKQNAYNNFMNLFIEEQPKCTINELQSFVGYNIVKHWIENIFDWAEEENDKDLKTVLSLIDKYYEMYMR